MIAVLSEGALEQKTLDDLHAAGWEVAAGVSVAPGSGERSSWSDLILQDSLHTALRNLNPYVPEQYLRQAATEVLAPQSQDALLENRRLHEILLAGYSGISYVDDEGVIVTPTIRFMSAEPVLNRYLAVNQVTIRDRETERRFDIILYVNGLPLVVMELKRAGVRSTTSQAAFNQLQTYVEEFPLAFRTVEVLVATDGVTARYGTAFTPWEHFARWNVDEHGAVVDADYHGEAATELELVIGGVLDPATFGEMLRDFITFEQKADQVTKKIAKPHQYFAVQKAIASTIAAVNSDGRAGVVWHTQGSGKSMEMELYTAKIMRHPRMANPTIIVITDRTELDTQLMGNFQGSSVLPENPVKVASRADLRAELAQRRTGGIYFTTLQKFGLTAEERASHLSHPLLSDRRNIIVIVDEAHRSHYDNIDGYAAHLKSALPNATLIAFTGTPIAEGERDTRRVFGDDIDTYDLLRAVEDGATVPVAFEPRLITLDRADDVTDEEIDDAAEEATESLDEADRDRLQRSVAVLNTVYGAPERLEELASDLVDHWERRRAAMQPFIGVPGKALVVCATREIAANLYEEITALRPDWHSDDDKRGKIKVVYTSSPADTATIKKHMRRPSANEEIKKRLRDEDDELEIVLVKDMLLTGFDSKPLHTLYLDRPLKGALLMQTLARVNRTFRGKEDGLLVAYAPVAENLGEAMREWTTQTGGQDGTPGTTAEEAAAAALETLDALDKIVGADWKPLWYSKDRRYDAVKLITSRLRDPATEGNSVEGDGYRRPVADRFRALAKGLARNYAIAGSPPPEGQAGEQRRRLEERRADVQFYEEVRVWLAKLDAQDRLARGEPVPDDVKRLLGEIVVASTESEGVIDIYAKAGLARPQLESLTPEWVEDASQPTKAQMAIDALRALLLSEMSATARHNTVRREQFSSQVNELMIRYTNQQLTAAQVIAALVEMAGDVRAEAGRGQTFDPPLGIDELAFYDLIAQNQSAVDVMGPGVLAQIARELVETMRRDVRTDWTVRADVKAKLRRNIKRLLRKYKYPPDQQGEAVREVVAQMEAMAPRLASEGT